MSPERLWKLSAALWPAHRRLALLVKKFNSAIYHNSLPPNVSFQPDIRFGHHGFGTVIHSNVVIGRRVWIWHNVTITVHAASTSPHRIVIEDDVRIGANSVIIAPAERSLRIGRGARIRKIEGGQLRYGPALAPDVIDIQARLALMGG